MFDRSAREVFLEKAYREVLGLLVEVRDYVAGPSKQDGAALPPQDRAMLAHELTKVTRRLTDAMAWLLLQKAVAAGEITAAEAAESEAAALPAGGLGDADPTRDVGNLPLAARGLIDRSRRISAEVSRLDASLRRAAGAG